MNKEAEQQLAQVEENLWIENTTDFFIKLERAETKLQRDAVRNWIEGQVIDAKEQGCFDKLREHMDGIMEQFSQRNNDRAKS